MKSRLIFLGISIIIFDQLTKFFFTNKSFFIFNYTTNTGAAFGILNDQNPLLTSLSLVIIGFILYLIKNEKEFRLPLTLILSGAIGNLIDRIIYGHVRDFIDLKFWPIFNIADSANTIGALLMVYLILKKSKQNHRV